MDWKNKTKVPEERTGAIAGNEVTSKAVGKYTNLQLLRRVTSANILFESNFYENADTTMSEMARLISIVNPQDTINLAIEIRDRQGLRHTPLWMLVLVHDLHKSDVSDAIVKICTRPDMLMDLSKMFMAYHKQQKLKLPKPFKRGIAKALEKFGEFQLARYKKDSHEIKLVDLVNLCHPKANEGLTKLIKGELKSEALENELSAGKDHISVYTEQINSNTLGSLAILRNLGNFDKKGLSPVLIRKAISQVNSKWITPLDYIKAYKNTNVAYVKELNDSMRKSFESFKIPGRTLVCIDVSGSMDNALHGKSDFTRLDLALGLGAVAPCFFENVTLVFTAGSDSARKGAHEIVPSDLGLNLYSYRKTVGSGGIFTYQLCEWLKSQGLAQDHDRLVVISDSQDIDVSRGSSVIPDTTPYNTSYIIDISAHKNGIKTSNWTAEINGVSDKLFHYIKEMEDAQ